MSRSQRKNPTPTNCTRQGHACFKKLAPSKVRGYKIEGSKHPVLNMFSTCSKLRFPTLLLLTPFFPCRVCNAMDWRGQATQENMEPLPTSGGRPRYTVAREGRGNARLPQRLEGHCLEIAPLRQLHCFTGAPVFRAWCNLRRPPPSPCPGEIRQALRSMPRTKRMRRLSVCLVFFPPS